MKKTDIILLGLKNQVTAISTKTGQAIWATKLPGSGWGDKFVTLISTSTQLFAHSNGQLSSLDIKTGDILWTNKLPGLGCGLASLAVPGGTSAPDIQIIAQQDSDAAATAANT